MEERETKQIYRRPGDKFQDPKSLLVETETRGDHQGLGNCNLRGNPGSRGSGEFLMVGTWSNSDSYCSSNLWTE